MSPRPLLLAVLGMSSLSAMPWIATTLPAQEAAPLELGKPAEGHLQDGETRIYEVELDADRGWRLEVTSGGHDAAVSVSDPEAAQLLSAKTLFGLGWTEVLTWTSKASGTYRITIAAAARGAPIGPYRLVLSAVPDITPQDRQALIAERLLSDSIQIRKTAYLAVDPQALQGAALERAEEMLMKALQLWRELGRRRDELRALVHLADIAQDRDAPARAAELLARALPLASEPEDAASRALILDRLGVVHVRLGDFVRARRSLDQAQSLWQEQGRRLGELWTGGTLCLLHLRQGEWDAARRCYEELLPEATRSGERRLEAQLASSLGGVYANLGEGDLAIAGYGRALSASQAIEDATTEAQVRNNLGALHRRLGEPDEAIAHYQEALSFFRRIDDRYWQARTLNNLGYAYFTLGDLARAETFFRDALALRRATGDRPGEAVTLRNLGRVAAEQGRLADAVEAHGQALAIARAAGDRRGEATALLLLGTALHAAALETGSDLAVAAEHLELALDIRRALGDRPGIAAILQERAGLQLDQGELQDAADTFTEAFELYRQIRDPIGEIEVRYGQARLGRRRGRLDEARRHLEATLTSVETLRTRITDPTRRASFLGARRGAFELLIDVLMDLHRADPAAGHDRDALAVSERARARTLLDLLEEPALELDRAIAPELRDGLRAAHRRLDAKVARQLDVLARSTDDGAVAAVESEVHQALAELETWRARARRASPRFAALSTPGTLGVRQIQNLLDAKTLLLEISLGDERSFLWTVTVDTVRSFELPGRETIENRARQTHEELTRLDLRSRRTRRDAARELARLILEPIAGQLTKPRLVVVADGALHYVPFATLPLPSNGASVESSLLERFEVVHLPSASALAQGRRLSASRPAAAKALAVLADPVFDARDPRLAATPRPQTAPVVAERFRSSPEVASFDRLPKTRDEALAIASLAPHGEVLTLLDFDASRKRVLAHELDAYRTLHFATHGLVHPQNPELSGLMLSQVDPAGRPQNGFLSLHDLLTLELGADLVVLSGCQTALGKEVRGEGFVGLARGFLYAGVPRVVASLWQVEDLATATLMTPFYRALFQENKAPAAALRAAQLALREDPRFADPFFWGTFLFQGDWH